MLTRLRSWWRRRRAERAAAGAEARLELDQQRLIGLGIAQAEKTVKLPVPDRVRRALEEALDADVAMHVETNIIVALDDQRWSSTKRGLSSYFKLGARVYPWNDLPRVPVATVDAVFDEAYVVLYPRFNTRAVRRAIFRALADYPTEIRLATELGAPEVRTSSYRHRPEQGCRCDGCATRPTPGPAPGTS